MRHQHVFCDEAACCFGTDESLYCGGLAAAVFELEVDELVIGRQRRSIWLARGSIQVRSTPSVATGIRGCGRTQWTHTSPRVLRVCQGFHMPGTYPTALAWALSSQLVE